MKRRPDGSGKAKVGFGGNARISGAAASRNDSPLPAGGGAWYLAGSFKASLRLSGKKVSDAGERVGSATSGNRSPEGQEGESGTKSWLRGAFSGSGLFNKSGSVPLDKRDQVGNSSPSRQLKKKDSGGSSPPRQVLDREDAKSSVPDGLNSPQLSVHPVPEIPGTPELQ
jgi:hypothetical protein